MNSIDFLLVFLLSSTSDVSGLWFSRTKNEKTSTTKGNCCIAPKANVNAQKANQGEEFFRRLTTLSTFQQDISSENMCDLMHFLFQRASLNQQSITFNKGMLILFDSSKKFFDRLTNPNKPDSWFDNVNPLKRLRQRRSGFTQAAPVLFRIISGRSGERYPAYAMKIPLTCFSKRFDHILFGELPSLSGHFPYSGKRIYIKPDRFAFDFKDLYSKLKNLRSTFKDFGEKIKCRAMDANSKLQCVKLQAFKDNTDQDFYKKWKSVLLAGNSNAKQIERFKKRIVKYGIREMDQQSRNFRSTSNQTPELIKTFRDALVAKYGKDDLKVRKGREIILTTSELLKTNPTCVSAEDIKCSI